MRPIGEERMMRIPVGRLCFSIIATILVTSGLASAQAGAGPDLSPPTEMPAAASTAPPTPAPSRGRAVLAVPGMIRATPARPAPEPPPPADAPGSVPLDAPAEMPSPPRPKVNAAGRPTVIESRPIEEGDPIGPPAARPGTTRRTTVTPPKVVDTPTPPPAPRRGRFFGLIPPPPVARTTPPAASRAPADDLSLVESPMKLRIEKQAREAIGDRARSVEVQMVGKKAVTIRATGVRFYQKRAVRKSIEALPALTGMKSTIEVLD